MAESTQVIIIGAGASGLVAARKFDENRIKFKIIEARGRIGGRIFTRIDNDLGLPVELGAEFIHGKPSESWDWINSRHLVAFDSSDRHQYGGESPKEAAEFWETIGYVLKQIPKNRGDVSFHDFLSGIYRGPKSSRALAGLFVEGFHAAELERISAAYLRQTELEAEAEQGYRIFRLLGGYQSLVDSLAHNLVKHKHRLELNSVAENVKWRPGHATVEYRSGRLRKTVSARACLVTVPLGVLKASDGLLFSPGLKEKERALSRLETGGVLKMVFKFKTRFWEKRFPDLGFLHCFGLDVPTWWTQLPLRTPILTAWTGGPAALRLSKLPKSKIEKAVLADLSRALGVRRSVVEQELLETYFHNWQTDPYSRGAYSYIGVGGLGAQYDLSRPLSRTLFFAGEATHYKGQSGTVDGAIASGHRAAAEILRVFKR